MRPDRQCQLYSATFKKRIEKLARDVLTDPVRVAQGDLGSASELVTQVRSTWFNQLGENCSQLLGIRICILSRIQIQHVCLCLFLFVFKLVVNCMFFFLFRL